MNKYIVIILFIQYALQLSYKNEYKYKKKGCYRSNILFIFAWVVTRMGSQSDSVGVRTQDPQLRRLLL